MLDLLVSSLALCSQQQRKRVASQSLTAAAPLERPHPGCARYQSLPHKGQSCSWHGIAQLSQQLSKALTLQGGRAVHRSSIALLVQHFVGLPPDTGIAPHDSAHYTNSALLSLQGLLQPSCLCTADASFHMRDKSALYTACEGAAAVQLIQHNHHLHHHQSFTKPAVLDSLHHMCGWKA